MASVCAWATILYQCQKDHCKRGRSKAKSRRCEVARDSPYLGPLRLTGTRWHFKEDCRISGSSSQSFLYLSGCQIHIESDFLAFFRSHSRIDLAFTLYSVW